MQNPNPANVLWTKATATGRRCKAIPDTPHPLMVWWYGGLRRNVGSTGAQQVTVVLRHVGAEPMDTESYAQSMVSFRHLRELRIGSVWQSGRHVGDAMFDQLDRQAVEFAPGGWRHVSERSAQQQHVHPPLENVYPLPEASPSDDGKPRSSRAWMLDFQAGSGVRILVPCIELLVRTYGASESVARLLTSRSPEEAKQFFFRDLTREVTSDGRWIIRPHRRMQLGDQAFLAYLQYDPYTIDAVQNLFGQIDEIEKSPRAGEAFIFPRVKPWLATAAIVSARGYWIRHEQIFLALRINVDEIRDGVKIQADWEIEKSTSHIIGSSGADVSIGPAQRDLENTAALAVHHVSQMHIHRPPAEIIGGDWAARSAFDSWDVEVTRDFRVRSILDSDAAHDTVNPCDENGGGSATTDEFVSHPVLRTQGMLLDMWNGLRSLAEKSPHFFRSVEWLHPERGFVDDDVPELIALPLDIRPEDEVSTADHWVYMDRDTKRPRGLLVMRLVMAAADGQTQVTAYILEIERRVHVSRKADAALKAREETFCGLVVVLDTATDFNGWLHDLRYRIRDVGGRVNSLHATHPDRVEWFTHSRARKEEQPVCRAALLNALSKIDIRP
jgi:hypothetical protein